MLILILDFREIFNYIYWLIVLVLLLYRVLILMEFGYRHRAFRSNLLSKKRSKGFLLQSLTQNHLLIGVFRDIWELIGLKLVVVKERPIGHAPLTNPQRTNTSHDKILRKHHIAYHACFVYYRLLVFVAFEDSHSLPRRPMPCVLAFVGT